MNFGNDTKVDSKKPRADDDKRTNAHQESPDGVGTFFYSNFLKEIPFGRNNRPQGVQNAPRCAAQVKPGTSRAEYGE